eukprot:TRINITY_DN1717_c0_g1_i4.p1 TRINITY_DN1717_c0_g1~~TRINITY_DN1717_c0_g1_i4.p1  ORF type:complete len:852 (+),score=250.50 TRINITY_DN1717_c0_g1_i4:161-2716(+)
MRYDFDSFTTHFGKCLFYVRCLIPFLKTLINEEFKLKSLKRDFSTIMRGHDFTTKLVHLTITNYGSDYIKQLLKPLVQNLLQEKKTLEMDISSSYIPADCTDLETAKKIENQKRKNSKRTIKVVLRFIEKITNSLMINQMPREIRAIAAHIAQLAKKHAPEMVYPLLGGFIMLRYICLAIISPEAFSILENNQLGSNESMRNLTYVAKILQMLSNSADISNNSGFQFFVNFFNEQQPIIYNYFEKIISDPKSINGQNWIDFEEHPIINLENLRSIPAQHLYDFHMQIYKLTQQNELEIDELHKDEQHVFIKFLQELGSPPTPTIQRNRSYAHSPFLNHEVQNEFSVLERQAILEYIKSGDIAKLSDLIKKNDMSNIVLPDECKEASWLHIASSEKYPVILEFVLRSSSLNINKISNEGWTPLHTAAKNGRIHNIYFLLKESAQVEATTIEGTIPLHYFVQHTININLNDIVEFYRYSQVLSRLAKDGQLVNEVTQKNKETPLHYACLAFGESVVNVHLLLHMKANPNVQDLRGFTPLHFAIFAKKKNLNIIRLLIENGADVNIVSHKGSCLDLAQKYPDILDIITRSNNNNNLILNQTILSQDKEQLIKNINLAKEQSDSKLLNDALKQKPELIINVTEPDMYNTNRRTWLHIAAAKGDLELVKILIANGAQVNTRSSLGWSPLHESAKRGHTKICLELLKNKADPGMLTLDNNLAFHFLVSHSISTSNLLEAYSFCRLFDELLNNGQFLNSQNSSFETPLLIACRDGDERVVSLLLKESANINIYDRSGYTPLHIAVRDKKISLIQLLIFHGAKPHFETMAGNCFSLARECREILDIFENIPDNQSNFIN